LRWEYVAGSEFFLVWSQDVPPNGFSDFDTPLIRSLFENIADQHPHNIFLLKFSYRFLELICLKNWRCFLRLFICFSWFFSVNSKVMEMKLFNYSMVRLLIILPLNKTIRHEIFYMYCISILLLHFSMHKQPKSWLLQGLCKQAELDTLEPQLKVLSGRVDALKAEIATIDDLIAPYPRWDVGRFGKCWFRFFEL
jgi:hypothetical protein